jgi:hypothetical protein
MQEQLEKVRKMALEGPLKEKGLKAVLVAPNAKGVWLPTRMVEATSYCKARCDGMVAIVYADGTVVLSLASAVQRITDVEANGEHLLTAPAVKTFAPDEKGDKDAAPAVDAKPAEGEATTADDKPVEGEATTADGKPVEGEARGNSRKNDRPATIPEKNQFP